MPNNHCAPMQRTFFKYPFAHFHHSSVLQYPSSNYCVDKILASNSLSFAHYQNSSYHRTEIDPTNPKITSIPPPNSSIVNVTNHTQTKRKRSWSRAVFSQLQRKGLEIQFQIQKYITKPDRRKLAARLGLTDAQVCDFL